jgi:hypothetical protein
METNLNFRNVNYNKSPDHLLFNTDIWISDLTFCKIEIEFLKKFINTYSFKSNTRNLFETIQLMNKNLDIYESKRKQLLEKITNANQQLKLNIKASLKKCSVKFIDEFNNVEDEVLIFKKTYKELKTTLYTYFYGTLKL